METMSSSCGLEIEQKSVASICSKREFQEIRKDDELKSAEVGMDEMKEENERLKMMLEGVEKDYHSLQLRFFDILHKESSKKDVTESAASSNNDETEEPEFVSLCLGRTARKDPKADEGIVGNCSKPREDNEDLEAGLMLGLNSECGLSMIEMESDLSTVKSSDEQKEAESGGTWPTHKSMKTRIGDDHEILDHMPAKRARVSVRARCDTPTMIDGCQWRKYGQKIAKGNPCPRAYYRCTVAPACPVRKQVQRCAEDMSILITTYEGTHNHPLPVSATAMASTTSAAVSMLLSGSSTSQPPCQNYPSCGNTPPILNGMNFIHFDQSRAKHSFFPNPTSALFPTITLDLASSSPPSHINRLSSSFTSIPRFPAINLNFCSSNPNIQPTFWGNEFPNHSTMPTEKTQHMRNIYMGNQFQEHIYQQPMKNQAPSKEVLAETLTKAISTDPSLRTVIAAAVSSIVGQGSSDGNQGGGDTCGSGLSLKLGETPRVAASNTLTQNGKGCFSSYFSRLSSANSQAENLMPLQTLLPFSLNISSAPSSVIDQINQ